MSLSTQALMQLLYDELRRLAQQKMKNERPGHTLQPTALVHEAYLKLCQVRDLEWKSVEHFKAMASKEMRRVLVDHAKKVNAKKRPSPKDRVTLSDKVFDPSNPALDLLLLDEVLERLEERDARQASIVEQRVFAGMSFSEIAIVLDVSERTVYSDWRFARAWLKRAFAPDESA